MDSRSLPINSTPISHSTSFPSSNTVDSSFSVPKNIPKPVGYIAKHPLLEKRVTYKRKRPSEEKKLQGSELSKKAKVSKQEEGFLELNEINETEVFGEYFSQLVKLVKSDKLIKRNIDWNLKYASSKESYYDPTRPEKNIFFKTLIEREGNTEDLKKLEYFFRHKINENRKEFSGEFNGIYKIFKNSLVPVKEEKKWKKVTPSDPIILAKNSTMSSLWILSKVLDLVRSKFPLLDFNGLRVFNGWVEGEVDFLNALADERIASYLYNDPSKSLGQFAEKILKENNPHNTQFWYTNDQHVKIADIVYISIGPNQFCTFNFPLKKWINDFFYPYIDYCIDKLQEQSANEKKPSGFFIAKIEDISIDYNIDSEKYDSEKYDNMEFISRDNVRRPFLDISKIFNERMRSKGFEFLGCIGLGPMNSAKTKEVIPIWIWRKK